jgi:hypothetical protein
MAINKLKQLSPDELLYYAHQYNFFITKKQAQEMTAYLRQNRIEPFDASGRAKMFKELERITDKATAQKAQQLLQEITKSYGLENMFK